MSIDLISQIDYPDSDGEPMADNTLQYEWIVTIKGGLDCKFEDDPQVFVAGNLLWYPVEGDNTTRIGPDVMVAFGRPKGYRGSYKQWVEGGIPPQVVFEVLSPGNRPGEMAQKKQFYQRHGVEEYYEFDPDRIKLRGWLRENDALVPIREMDGWVSPRLGIRFELGEDLTLYAEDGRRFKTFLETGQAEREMERQAEWERQRADQESHRAERAEQRADLVQKTANQERQRAEQANQYATKESLRADQEQRRAELERQRADHASQIAEQERQRAEQAGQLAEQERQRAEQERQRAEQERQRAERLAERLRALGLDLED